MTDARTKRTQTLTAAAKAKSQAKTQVAEQAIRTLVKRSEPITFQAVQREAGVSHAFLYNHPDLRGRIERLRAQARTTPTPAAASAHAENTVVLALTSQITRLKKLHRRKSKPCRTRGNRPTARTSTCAANSPAAAKPAHRGPRSSSVPADHVISIEGTI